MSVLNVTEVKEFKKRKEDAVKLSKRLNKPVSDEDIDVLYVLDKIKSELATVHKSFDNATDEMLIDGFIYEIKSLNMKYQFYIKLCKERGLIANVL